MIDKYLGFTYKGKHSSEFNAFIINEGEDLMFPNFPSFSNEVIFPQFGEIGHYMGRNVESREISFTIFASNLTKKGYREMLRWLTEESSENSLLQFDYNLYFGYRVRLDSIDEGAFIPEVNCDEGPNTYAVELNVSFITTNDWAAQYVHDIEIPLINERFISYANLFDFSIRKTFSIHSTYEVRVENRGNLPIFINLEILPFVDKDLDIYEDSLNVLVKKRNLNREEELSIIYEFQSGQADRTFVLGKYGLILGESEEGESFFLSFKKNEGVLKIDPKETSLIEISSTLAQNDSVKVGFMTEKVIIKPILREII